MTTTAHFQIIVTIACAIFGVVVAILGYLIRATVKFTVMSTSIQTLDGTVNKLSDKMADVIVEVAIASNTDISLKERIRALEERKK